MKYKFITANQKIFSIRLMCKVLCVSKSAYYSWRKQPCSARQQANLDLMKRIKEIFNNSKCRYGYRKVYHHLKHDGLNCSKNRVSRIMGQNKLYSKAKKRFKATTNSKHDHPISDNVLNREFNALKPNTHWVGDISYIQTKEGWLYLSTVIDLYSRAVVGWSVSSRMTSQLIEDSFLNAIWSRKPHPGLLFHSDRGSQYAGHAFQKLLEQHQAISSMSRKANCWDNAVAESFFKIIKSELIYHEDYVTRDEAKNSIFEYIETFYNRKRLHSSIEYKSPMQFEEAV